jgi:hypothetical protein
MLPARYVALGLARVELEVEVLPNVVSKEVQRPQGVGESTDDMDVVLNPLQCPLLINNHYWQAMYRLFRALSSAAEII